DTNVSAHQSNKITADRQSQTGPLFRIYAAPALSKGLEDSLLLRCADARPRVFNLEGRHAIPPRSPQRNAAGCREFHRVSQQVDQHLTQLAFVSQHMLGQLCSELKGQIQPLDLGL